MLRLSSVRFNKFGAYTALAIAPILLIGSATLSKPHPSIAQSSAGSAAMFTLPNQVNKGTTVRIDGSSSLQTINTTLKQRFEQQFKGTKVELSEAGSEAALQALIDEQVDLVGMGRALTAEEKTQGLVEVPLARHKIAIVVSPENSFSGDLTVEQFGQLFRGEIQDWSELGGSAGAIRFVDRPEVSDTRQAFKNYPVFQGAPFQTGSNAAVVDADQTDAVVKALGEDGLGYAIVDQVTDRSDVRILSMHEVLPTDARYPFSQPLTYVYKGPEPNLAVQSFLGYATAAENQSLVDSSSWAGGAADGSAADGSAADGSATDATAGGVAAGGVAGSADGSATAGADGTAGTTAGTTGDSADAGVAGGDGFDGNAEGLGDPTGRVTGDADDASGRAGNFRWWPWLLLPLLAGGLWWLLGRGGGGGGAIAPAAAGVDKSRLILTPRDCKTAYAYWELSDRDQRYLNASSNRALSLRLYEDLVDATVGRGSSRNLIKQVNCSDNGHDQHFNIPIDDRDYFVELGVENDGEWTVLDRSDSVRVPSCQSSQGSFSGIGSATVPGKIVPGKTASVVPLSKTAVSKTTAAKNIASKTPASKTPASKTNAAVATGLAGAAAGAAGVAAMGTQRAQASRQQVLNGAAPGESVTPSQIILVPRNQSDAYVYWEVAPARHQALRASGGRTLKLRIHDVTNIDMDTQAPLGTQEYICDEHSQDKQVSLPNSDRDYLADLGYETTDGRWLRLARSLSVRPSSHSVSV
ncbi:MAG: DUF4912 domain-containing protein [Cyanobacteria bacterium P01_F01_bin.53]